MADGSFTVGYDNFENYIIRDGELGCGEYGVRVFNTVDELLSQYTITHQYKII